jgi:hypothetical protein
VELHSALALALEAFVRGCCPADPSALLEDRTAERAGLRSATPLTAALALFSAAVAHRMDFAGAGGVAAFALSLTPRRPCA